MKRSFAFLSILAAAVPLAHAAPAPGEDSMTELQSQVSRRASVLSTATGMSQAMHDGNKAVAGNIGGSGKAPDWRSAEIRSASRDVGRSGIGNSLNERALNPQPLPPTRQLPNRPTTPRQDLVSLNPQPLPPVETGRRPAAAGNDKALTTGIIIVGGKSGVAR